MHQNRESEKGRRRKNGKGRRSEFVGRGIEKRGREISGRIKIEREDTKERREREQILK